MTTRTATSEIDALETAEWFADLPDTLAADAIADTANNIDRLARKGGALDGAPVLQRKIGSNTYAVRGTDADGPFIGIVYHKTRVITVRPYPLRVVLDSGGWRSVTTARRFDDYLMRPFVVRWQNGGTVDTAAPRVPYTSKCRRRPVVATGEKVNHPYRQWRVVNGLMKRDAEPTDSFSDVHRPLRRGEDHPTSCYGCKGTGSETVNIRQTVAYYDGITLTSDSAYPDGIEPDPAKVVAAIAAATAADSVTKAIRQFVASDLVTERLATMADEIRATGGVTTAGDCFGCVFALNGERGGMTKDTDPMSGHWESHIVEGYLPASGVIAALRAVGYPHPGVILTFGGTESVTRALVRYLAPRVTAAGLEASRRELGDN